MFFVGLDPHKRYITVAGPPNGPGDGRAGGHAVLGMARAAAPGLAQWPNADTGTPMSCQEHVRVLT